DGELGTDDERGEDHPRGGVGGRIGAGGSGSSGSRGAATRSGGVRRRPQRRAAMSRSVTYTTSATARMPSSAPATGLLPEQDEPDRLHGGDDADEHEEPGRLVVTHCRVVISYSSPRVLTSV